MASEIETLAAAIKSAEAGVRNAHERYRRGASCDVVNRADQRLLDAWDDWQCCRDGRIPCGRDR